MVFRSPSIALFGPLIAGCTAMGSPAQEGPRVVAHGNGGDACPGAVPTVIEDAVALAPHWHRIAAGREAPTVDFVRDRLFLVPLGEGRGGRLEVTQALHGRGLLVRIEGAAGAAATAERWALVAVSRSWRPRDVAFEADSGAVGGCIAFRRSAAGGVPCAPHVTWTSDEAVVPQVFTDALAYANFLGAHGMAVDDTAGIDFAKVVLFVAPVAPRTAVEPSEPPDRLDVHQAPGLVVVRTARDVRSGDAAAEFAATTFGVHILPRVEGILQVDAPTATDPHVVRRVAEFPVADPTRSPLLGVLRYCTLEVPAVPATVCERARTAAEWRDLRRRHLEAIPLPDDLCTFDGASIVFVATGQGHAWPGFEFEVTEEEGVDVLTAIQRLPSGEDPGLHSHAFLAVVPDRKGPLAVVLREWCAGPIGEKTLRVFPGQSR